MPFTHARIYVFLQENRVKLYGLLVFSLCHLIICHSHPSKTIYIFCNIIFNSIVAFDCKFAQYFTQYLIAGNSSCLRISLLNTLLRQTSFQRNVCKCLQGFPYSIFSKVIYRLVIPRLLLLQPSSLCHSCHFLLLIVVGFTNML